MSEFAQVCVKLFWHDKFIAPIPIPNPIPSLDPGYIRHLEPDICGLSGSMTSRLWL